MNWVEIQRDWEQMKIVLKTHWPELTMQDIDAIQGDRARLANLLQERRRLSAQDAENTICAFEDDVRFPGAVK